MSALNLGVNVDHVATLRQARGTTYPDPMQAADIARQAGADGITVHLREDRRHIQDKDVVAIKENVKLPLNFEMAATSEMVAIALEVKPNEVMLVPEKREELTTEGGLDVVQLAADLEKTISPLKQANIPVSIFIDPTESQISACSALGVDIVELHTGEYADAEFDSREMRTELARITSAAAMADELGLTVHAGHGLHYQNVQAIAAIPELVCLNIGHAIISRAVLTGLHEAVFTMKNIMNKARLDEWG